MPNLSISFLGGFQATLHGNQITKFEADSARALFAYLVMETAVSHQREHLATLLWPEEPTKTGLHNLRQALYRMRTAFGDRQANPQFFQVTRKTIQFQPTTSYSLDVTEFKTLITQVDQHDHKQMATCIQCRDKLEKAATLYGGDFLNQFLFNSNPFEEWLIHHREAFRLQAGSIFQRLATYYAAEKAFEKAQYYLRQQLVLNPWQETVHRQLMTVMKQSGRYADAFNHYQTFSTQLYEALGVAPQPETMALYESMRSQDWGKEHRLPQKEPSQLPPHNLPIHLTPFVGRHQEITEIASRARKSECRLITIYGPGGIGKTRLAIEVGQQIRLLYPHGTYFVPLAPITSPKAIIPTIAAALNFTFFGNEDNKTQLLNYLRQKEMLLIIDNFEHLMTGTDLILDILKTAPGITILVTSREALNYQAEWLYKLQGLSYPVDDPVPTAKPHDAVQLFLNSAERAQIQFQVSQEQWPHIAQICRLVQGMPLAIELAAPMVRRWSCQQIAQEITRNIDLLHTTMRDVPPRQQSVRAVFQYSWQSLTLDEQKVLMKLAVFPGNFTVDAATYVTNATAVLLKSLVDKSFLQQITATRYEPHKLLRQYAYEYLADQPEIQHEVHDLHCQYYADFLFQRETLLDGAQQVESLDMIGREITNINEAWAWAVEHKNLVEVEKCLGSLFQYYHLRSEVKFGERLVSLAAEVLDKLPNPTPQLELILWRLRLYQGNYWHRLSRSKNAEEILHACLNYFQATNHIKEMAMSLIILATILLEKGELDKAEKLFSEVSTLTKSTNYHRLQTISLIGLCDVYWYKSEFDTALTFCKEALKISRANENKFHEGIALNFLGMLANDLGNFQQAEQYLEASLTIRRQLKDVNGEGGVLSNLGNMYMMQGQLFAAKNHLEQATHIRRDLGCRLAEATDRQRVGILLLNLGDAHSATNHLEKALSNFRELNDLWGIGRTNAILSRAAYYLGEKDAAIDYAQQAVKTAEERKNNRELAYALTNLGNALLQLNRLDEAQQAYEEAIALRQAPKEYHLVVESQAGLAAVCMAQDNWPKAKEQVQAMMDWLENNPLVGVDDPLRIHLICFKVLNFFQDPKADEVLEQAHDLLQKQAATLTDIEMKRKFLEEVPTNYELTAVWANAKNC